MHYFNFKTITVIKVINLWFIHPISINIRLVTVSTLAMFHIRKSIYGIFFFIFRTVLAFSERSRLRFFKDFLFKTFKIIKVWFFFNNTTEPVKIFKHTNEAIRWKFVWRKFRTAKIPYGEKSVRRNCRTANNHDGKNSVRRKILRRKILRRNFRPRISHIKPRQDLMWFKARMKQMGVFCLLEGRAIRAYGLHFLIKYVTHTPSTPNHQQEAVALRRKV